MKIPIRELLRTFAFPIAIFIVHVTILVPVDVYNIYLWFDIPMHLLGGFAVGLSYFIILRKGYFGKLQIGPLLIITISFVALTTILWEFAELGADFFFRLGWQLGLPDTMADIALGLTGGLFAGIIGIIRSHKSL